VCNPSRGEALPELNQEIRKAGVHCEDMGKFKVLVVPEKIGKRYTNDRRQTLTLLLKIVEDSPYLESKNAAFIAMALISPPRGQFFSLYIIITPEKYEVKNLLGNTRTGFSFFIRLELQKIIPGKSQ